MNERGKGGIASFCSEYILVETRGRRSNVGMWSVLENLSCGFGMIGAVPLLLGDSKHSSDRGHAIEQ